MQFTEMSIAIAILDTMPLMDNVNLAQKELFLMKISNNANLYVPKMKSILQTKKSVYVFKTTFISMEMIFVQNVLKQQSIHLKKNNVFVLKNSFNIQKINKNASQYAELMNN